ncbi:hypothetical protein CALVIDRAFT_376884 [Calocera viscosa TUFC12733]|uniref:Uncharacterized protein n=1 Tax=Calocera viscosa (strain TUFC12733) TaxID=1330018 RepID=A0A167PZP9_CALVF|nr:hypothetical protein CALVIDRAFT_376884 [Calocera viscosa TUFC12733]
MPVNPQFDPLIQDARTHFVLRHVTHSGQGIAPVPGKHMLEYACVKALATAAFTRAQGRDLAERVVNDEFAERIKDTLHANPVSARYTLPQLATLPEFTALLRYIPPEVHGILDVRGLFDYLSNHAGPGPRYAVVTSTLGCNPTALFSIRSSPLECPLYILYTPCSFADPADAFLTVVSPGCEEKTVGSLTQKLTGGNFDGLAEQPFACQVYLFRPAEGTGAESTLPTPPPSPRICTEDLPRAADPQPARPPPPPSRTRLATLDPGPSRPRPTSAPAAFPPAQAREIAHLRDVNEWLDSERRHFWDRAVYWHGEVKQRYEQDKREWESMTAHYHAQLLAMDGRLREMRVEYAAQQAYAEQLQREVGRLRSAGAQRPFSYPMYPQAPPVYVPMQPETLDRLDVAERQRGWSYAGGHWNWCPHEAFTGGGAPGDTRPPQVRAAAARQESRARSVNGDGQERATIDISEFKRRGRTPPADDPQLEGPGPPARQSTTRPPTPSRSRAGSPHTRAEAGSRVPPKPNGWSSPSHRVTRPPAGILKSPQGEPSISCAEKCFELITARPSSQPHLVREASPSDERAELVGRAQGAREDVEDDRIR